MSSICGECQLPIGTCSWSRSFQPVPGWEATPTRILVQKYSHGKFKSGYMDSYNVTSCPLYIPPKKGRARVQHYQKGGIIAEDVVTHKKTKYTSVRAACQDGGFSAAGVRDVLEGRRLTHHGYMFYHERSNEE